MVITRIKEERELDFTVICFKTDATMLSVNAAFFFFSAEIKSTSIRS